MRHYKMFLAINLPKPSAASPIVKVAIDDIILFMQRFKYKVAKKPK